MGRPPKTNCEINGIRYFRLRSTIDGVQKTFYGKSETEAKKKRDDYLKTHREDVLTRSQKDFRATLGDRAEQFINDVLSVSQKYAQATRYRYELAYRTHVADAPIAKQNASRLKAAEIQKFYNSLDVSKQTMATINKFMRALCKWMVLNEYSQDFLLAVEMPKKPENKRHEGIVVWSDDEIKTILDAIPGHRLYFLIYVLLYTGARISEAIALRYEDMENGTVSIVRQYYMGEMKHPKYNSAREVPIHEELAKAFDVHKAWHREEMKKNGYKTDLLFTTSTGNIYDPVNLRRALKRFCNAHGIEYKHPHAFRSTFCTQLCRCGVPLEVASSLMGHKSIEVTAKHYALVRKDTKEDAIALLHY